MPGEQIDLASDPGDGRGAGSRWTQTNPTGESRPFIGIYFACCDVYSRVYLSQQRDAYEGRCPRCLRRVSLPLSAHDPGARFFIARPG